MLQSINCIQTGQILIDENLRSFILCNNCHTDFISLQDFHRHFGKCDGYDNFLKPNLRIKYNSNNCTQLLGKCGQSIKEYLIYDINDVEFVFPPTHPDKEDKSFIDLVHIEEELLDPRWYTDITNEAKNVKKAAKVTVPKTTTTTTATNTSCKRSLHYDKLVEDVTPFVQFKENVKTNNRHSVVSKTNRQKKVEPKDPTPHQLNGKKAVSEPSSPVKRKLPAPLPKDNAQKISINTIAQQKNVTTEKPADTLKHPVKRRKLVRENGSCLKLPSPNQVELVKTPLNVNIKAAPPITATAEKQTAQILNKLQTLGLQIKRTQSNVSVNTKTDNKTLELLHKLQSKGMKIKILKQSATTPTAASATKVGVTNTAKKTIDIPTTPTTAILPLNKNIIIRKVH